MLLLIHERDRWELPPEPEPEPIGRHRRPPRVSRGAVKPLLAIVLFAAGMVLSGIVADLLVLASLITVWSAACGLLPYGLGLKEHHQ